ncbi:DUF1330 domain-containing protein [Kozakia baliensis]|uniref:DUF1330 domain-containing protein n=1 Tax=Kozakia baliensis TaxID=153496 RepID=UPI000495A4DC|nr:DUF1330 domain-containing protein [Kozakia baliensis]AOX20558.1 hypothetical protein A0U90_09890 [Kozakia baliensis]
MSAYFVFTREATLDESEMKKYGELVGPTFKGHPAKILAAYGAQEEVEGEGPEGIVIIEFPSKEAALAWYNGPEYKEVRQHRFKGGKYRATLVEGL